MLQNEHNFKHQEITCETCQTQDHVVEDNFHNEIYCMKCGTVIQDATLPKITLLIQNNNSEPDE